MLAYGLTLFLAVSLNFLIPRAMPGDPLALIAGDAVRQMGAERIAELRQAYGLDRPLGDQYLAYLGRLARADLGRSYRYSGGRSVSAVLLERFGWTFFLVFVSLTTATLLGSLLGAWSAWRHGRSSDLGLLTAVFALRSMPAFWLAMILIPLLAVNLRLFPSGDSYSFPRPTGLPGLFDTLHHAALPILVLMISHLPTPFAIMRSATLGVLGADFIRTARAKGLPEKVVLYRHAMRNAILPVLTSFALDFGQLLGGVTLIETVFNYRGLGNMMFEAVKTRDYPLLQGGFLLFTLVVLAMNLLTDLLYPRLDPRLRGGRA
jgi:peptide/nickel transport system permease protein